MQNNTIKIFFSEGFEDYELLDTGEGEKLERFGKYIFVRPFEDAVWKKSLAKDIWLKADGKFVSSKKGSKAGWVMNNKNIEKKWVMSYKDLKFNATPTSFRHLSFFPEQSSHWDFINEKIKNAERRINFLNLFGYTGVASLSALSADADVTHVDASKESLTKLKENQEISGLSDKPLRIILDDVLKFIEKEAKRGNKYDAIIMDPPKFGRGPKGETWKIQESLPRLLNAVKNILSDKPLFVIITSYSTDSSSLDLGYALQDTMKDLNGSVEQGELCVIEQSNKRAISMAHSAIWSAK